MSVLSLLFPVRCPYCGVLIGGRETECQACRAQFSEEVYLRWVTEETLCISPFRYEGYVRKSILLMKKDGKKVRFASFAGQIVRLVQQMEAVPDIVTDVPMYWLSRWRRGFNQAEQIARYTAAGCGCAYAGLLKKIKKNRVQHHLGAEERRLNVQGAYAVRAPDSIRGKRILLLDDVCTTGSTMAMCAGILRQYGAKSVLCAAAAMASFDVAHGLTVEQASAVLHTAQKEIIS